MNIKIQIMFYIYGKLKNQFAIWDKSGQIRAAISMQATFLIYINELLQTEVTLYWGKLDIWGWEYD